MVLEHQIQPLPLPTKASKIDSTLGCCGSERYVLSSRVADSDFAGCFLRATLVPSVVSQAT